jgi:ankyrin repeat protein
MNMDEMNIEVLECARYGEPEDLQILLTAGADPNFQDSDGNTALHKGRWH